MADVTFLPSPVSGKEKAHKHKQIFPVIARAGGVSRPGGGGVSRPVARGQKFMCCVRNPRNIPKRFRPGTRPGGIGFPAGRIGDRGDREIVYVPNVYVPFPAPTTVTIEKLQGDQISMPSSWNKKYNKHTLQPENIAYIHICFGN